MALKEEVVKEINETVQKAIETGLVEALLSNNVFLGLLALAMFLGAAVVLLPKLIGSKELQIIDSDRDRMERITQSLTTRIPDILTSQQALQTTVERLERQNTNNFDNINREINRLIDTVNRLT